MTRASERFFGAARAKLDRLRASWASVLHDDPDDRRADRAHAGAVVKVAGRMRAAPAKVAQLRAYLEGGLGEAARLELSTLWDDVPPDPPRAIRDVIEADLGAPPEQLFAEWSDEPLASASLGQVHAAKLADGTDVAVKVQYSGVAAALLEDLSSPSLVRELVGPGLGDNAAAETLAALRTSLLRELDYEAERASIDRFGRALRNDPRIVLPRAIADRSRGRVLTMTRLFGEPLRALESQDERNEVARILFRFAFGAPLRHGIVNGDPHPGNYLVQRGDTIRVGFVDFGLVEELGDLQAIDRRLLLSFVHRDGEELRYAAHEEGLVPRAGTFDHAAWRDFEHALGAPFVKRGARPFGPRQAAELVRVTSYLLQAGSVRLSPSAVVLWRQRLAALTVIASLAPLVDWRRELCEVLDDDSHPTPLYERYL